MSAILMEFRDFVVACSECDDVNLYPDADEREQARGGADCPACGEGTLRLVRAHVVVSEEPEA